MTSKSIELAAADVEVQVVLYYEHRAIHRGVGQLSGPARLRVAAPYPPFALNTYVEIELSRRGSSRKRSRTRRLPAVVVELAPEQMDLRLECSPEEVGSALDLSFPGEGDTV